MLGSIYLFIFVYDAFLYEVYKFYTQNRGRFFSDDVSSRMFSSNATDWLSITRFPDSAFTSWFCGDLIYFFMFLSYTWGSSDATDVNCNVDQHPNLLRLCFVKQTPHINVWNKSCASVKLYSRYICNSETSRYWCIFTIIAFSLDRSP
jgi:hypothetical protein